MNHESGVQARQRHVTAARRALAVGLLALLLLGGTWGATSISQAAPARAASASVVTGMPFFDNYTLPEYILPVVGEGPGSIWGGDLAAVYSELFFRVGGQFELLILGEFPKARYFSITVYDDHGTVLQSLRDSEIAPLVPGTENPYAPGGPEWSEDTLYAVSVKLGGEAMSITEECDTGWDVRQNELDAGLRHNYYTLYPPPDSWVYSPYHMNFSVVHPDPDVGTIVHDDGETSLAGVVMLRTFLADTEPNGGAFDLTRPLMWLRQVSDGCPVQLAAPGSYLPPTCPEGYLPPYFCWYRHDDVMNRFQEAAHRLREDEVGWLTPFGAAPNNVQWFRSGEYIVTSNPDTSYLIANLPTALRPEAINAAGTVLRLRVRMPTMPAIPCDGPECILNGDEYLRYWSLSFTGLPQDALYTITDRDLVLDEDGFATILVSFGTPIDTDLFNASTGYTVIELVDEFGDPPPVTHMVMRTILPADNFICSGREIPYHTSEHNETGGYMGRMAPLVDQRSPIVDVAGGLPAQALPFSHPPTQCVLP